MMRMNTKSPGVGPMNGSSAAGGGAESGGIGEWELRPGGMLVQKRNADSDRSSAPPPTIRVRVKYGSTYHEINISSQATFGELKKMLSGPTGLHHQDQKLIYKDKERDSKAFLDTTGVKDRSKIVLVEDPISQERRYLEMRRNAKMEKASKNISEISLEVDRLGGQVSALESIIGKGGKVAETSLLTLIELLMNQLLKLDGITADGDAKLQRKMQVRRVQKYVETLDVLKIKNASLTSNGDQNPTQHNPRQSNGHKSIPGHEQQAKHFEGQLRHSVGHLPINQQPGEREQQSRHSTSGVVVTTKWETFDSTPASVPHPTSSTSTSAINNSAQPKFNWEFFEFQ